MRDMKCSATITTVLAMIPAIWAADSNLSDKFYDAIRRDDAAGVKHLLEDGANVNARDSRGATPLMYVAAVGSSKTMRLLIAAGADVNAKNSFDSTALMWCANDRDKVRLLLEKGADVNMRSKQGRTPLLIASSHDGNLEVVRLLLAMGADPNTRDKLQNSPLLQAAGANDTAMVKFFLDSGADANTKNLDGFTPLMMAAGYGNVDAVKMLLAKGAAVNAASASFGLPVKNGRVALGYLTPLLLAASSGKPACVQLLLDAGADVNAKDVRGMTPLMLAIGTDRPNESIVRMLLDKKADTAIKSKAEESALAWAYKFQHPEILSALTKAAGEVSPPDRTLAALKVQPPTLRLTALKVQPPTLRLTADEAVRSKDLLLAAQKGIALLQKTSGIFFKEGGCMSCHSHNITTMAVAVVRPRGVPVDQIIANEHIRGTRLQFAAFSEGMLQCIDPPAVDLLTYALLALAFEGAEADRTTDAMVHNLMAQQHADGTFGLGGIARPPMADGDFSRVAMAIRVLRQYGPPARQPEVDERIARAAKWLLNAQPLTTEDAVMQLLGAKWSGAGESTVRQFRQKLMALQREDGGWAQTPHLKSDAYATGTALYALNQSGGLPVGDPAYQKGSRYLLETQRADGSWCVASRSPKFQPYFDGGFPYGHDQWISQMATGWASISLSLALPETRAALHW